MQIDAFSCILRVKSLLSEYEVFPLLSSLYLNFIRFNGEHLLTLFESKFQSLMNNVQWKDPRYSLATHMSEKI